MKASAVFLSGLWAVSLSAGVLVTYDFSAMPGDQIETPVGGGDFSVNASPLKVGPGLMTLPTYGTTTATDFSSAASLNVDGGDYWEFTISPEDGFVYRFESVDFTYIRSTKGPQALALRSDLDAFSSDIAPAMAAVPGGYQSIHMAATGPVYSDEPQAYRIYGYASTSRAGSGAFSGLSPFTVNGSVQSILARYNFAGAAGNESSVIPSHAANRFVAYKLVRGPGLVSTVTAPNTFCAAGWTTGSKLVAEDYFEFTVSPREGGYTLSALLFSEYNTASGPAFFSIRSSLDGFQQDIVAPIPKNASAYARKHALALDERFANIREPVIFRFYAWGATSGSGVWGLGGVEPDARLVVVGSVLADRLSSIPIPPAVSQTTGALGKVIFNEDGDFTYDKTATNESGWHEKLDGMLSPVGGLLAGKESLAYAIQTSEVMLYPTAVGSKWGWDPASPPPSSSVLTQFPVAVQAGCDGVAWAGQKAAAMQSGFIAVYRVNDAHYIGGTTPYLESKFWRDHPELRFGTSPFTPAQDPTGVSINYAKLFDYAKPALVAHKIALVSEAIDRYKHVIDGFELDFLRSPPFFHQEDAWDSREMMTEFVSSVRSRLDLAEAATGKTMRLLVRVPPGIKNCEAHGLDIRAWVASGLVQVVIPAQVMTLQHDTPLDEFMEICRPAGVAVYPALYRRVKTTYPFSALPPSSASGLTQNASEALLHGAILSHQAMLADGFEIYNFNLPLSAASTDVFSRVETAQMTKARVYVVTPADNAFISKFTEAAKQVPFRIDPVITTKICGIYLGEDPAFIPANYYVGLRIGFNKVDMSRNWISVSVNGVVFPLDATNSNVTAIPPLHNADGPYSYLQIDVAGAGLVLRRGYNDIRFDYKMTAQDIAAAYGATENERKRIIVSEIQLGVLPPSS